MVPTARIDGETRRKVDGRRLSCCCPLFPGSGCLLEPPAGNCGLGERRSVETHRMERKAIAIQRRHGGGYPRQRMSRRWGKHNERDEIGRRTVVQVLKRRFPPVRSASLAHGAMHGRFVRAGPQQCKQKMQAFITAPCPLWLSLVAWLSRMDVTFLSLLFFGLILDHGTGDAMMMRKEERRMAKSTRYDTIRRRF